MSSSYSIAEAKNALPSLVHAAETGTCVQITRRGKPVAVLLSMDDYSRLTHPQPSFGTALQAFLSHPPEPLPPDDTFDNLRDSSPGRSFHW
ncbi:prevent-host-death family protein [bacterium (Candidatus Blackallbacteria) CG17_big_fil_post_rev_8_21_14_2_50_48_46]|uniref:Antitoxin n=1 Tax=bacterium (Candidatus Blackallbacteria) CG17_big_fil_post_rev_8_21_14_2_50_48_46 TaxID=2014261 RepID=A0A2M7G494_9BACT|nr:MAG: prevent-host-death family protein [bacterium (Candidatus Blackallbacteria) CG18_big_fil_WC_8_21_14_2_50_49_26]PIW16683.1 MAG: prevent-host-death family protein [bacterium (Candidatus Blackallbacteria) CG17_big_fil_post_rev_8_21_14_2_50_48_46]PIW46189.1 MAG: prevent-host-death family protein [bacterium (Candidatus Blackallbacteria) CG13_big_fil_rev_8_21_14_2_50_49_14]